MKELIITCIAGSIMVICLLIFIVGNENSLKPKIYDTYYEYNIDNNYVNGEIVKTDTIAVDTIKIERK